MSEFYYTELDGNQSDMSQSSPPSQGSPSTQVQVQGTSSVLQAEKEIIPGLPPSHVPGFVFYYFLD